MSRQKGCDYSMASFEELLAEMQANNGKISIEVKKVRDKVIADDISILFLKQDIASLKLNIYDLMSNIKLFRQQLSDDSFDKLEMEVSLTRIEESLQTMECQLNGVEKILREHFHQMSDYFPRELPHE